MTYDEIYTDVLNYVETNNLTLQQLAAVTATQVISVLNITDNDDIGRLRRGWQSLRQRVKNQMIAASEAAELSALKAVAATWMSVNFPEAVWERSGKTITIYLDGLP